MKEIYKIYDKIFKRIFALSNLAIINLINGLFGTNYPLDSEVTYPNKESVNAELTNRFADLFITIGGKATYHLEAQMTQDETIVIRVFEYSFYYAMENRGNDWELNFPEPMVIYLDEMSDRPEKSILSLHFWTKEVFRYEVRNFYYLDHDVTELNQRKLVILIPFQLLKLRKLISKEPTRANFQQLQRLIQHDIMDSIKANLTVGNITQDDANQLLELTRQLYDHIYKHYEELGGEEEMKPLLSGAMELPMDKYRKRIDELEAENEAERREKEVANQKVEAANRKAEEERQKVEAANQEIERLRKLLQEKSGNII
ncbi:MAG: hypothetical protein PHV18_14970 [Lachnospiraceae bacterium]|nr:hypothetical protein [Lachnospiraceae bacterium]